VVVKEAAVRRQNGVVRGPLTVRCHRWRQIEAIAAFNRLYKT
jgi:hypothetical protein